MSYFTDVNFGSKIDSSCLELRGNKQIISMMKADIKAFSKTTRDESQAWRKFYSQKAKGIATWDNRPAWRTTNRTHMRHMFLAYGYLRFRSWEEIESNTKELRLDGDCSFNKVYYHGGPREDLICAIIKYYSEKLQEALNAA